MYAIEFEATVKNGVIQLPKEYQGQFTSHIKVIVLKEEGGQTDVTATFPSFDQAMGFDVIAIDTTQWTFRRAEIYERS
jgi:hypothetical protein